MACGLAQHLPKEYLLGLLSLRAFGWNLRPLALPLEGQFHPWLLHGFRVSSEGRGGGRVLAPRINLWSVGQLHRPLEILPCASAKPGSF